MRRLRHLLLTVTLLGCAACGKLGTGCEPASEQTSTAAARERLDHRLGRGGPEEEGRWTRIRAPKSSDDEELETQIRQLEALGYASGTKTAPSLSGVTLHDRSRASEGLNFYTSGHAAEAVLLRMDGQVVHRWARDFWDVFPDDRAERTQPGTHHWRRAQLLPNGDILAIHEGLGLVKLDKDSNVIWAKRNGAHHDLHVLASGDIAVLAREAKVIKRVDARRPTLEDFVLILDAEGREKERYSVLQAFERSKAHRQIWDESTRRWGDIFHTNSIQVLGGALAETDGAFAAGNILLSSRNLDAIFVLAPARNEVVWALRGDFRAQHDARELDGGRVMLFDNGGGRRGSAVQRFDAATRELIDEYRGTAEHLFYSRTCGTAQPLPNGNTLITESDNGRAFEITPDGAIVWEFYNPHRAGPQDEFIATLFRVDRVESKKGSDPF
jgi:outer membrane protein assembly factor BamB